MLCELSSFESHNKILIYPYQIIGDLSDGLILDSDSKIINIIDQKSFPHDLKRNICSYRDYYT